MKRRAFVAAVLGAALATACGDAREVRVDPRGYDAFFLWAGVPASPALARAKTVYLLAGEVRADDEDRFVPLRPATPKVAHADIWLILRTERIDWGSRSIAACWPIWRAGRQPATG